MLFLCIVFSASVYSVHFFIINMDGRTENIGRIIFYLVELFTEKINRFIAIIFSYIFSYVWNQVRQWRALEDSAGDAACLCLSLFP